MQPRWERTGSHCSGGGDVKLAGVGVEGAPGVMTTVVAVAAETEETDVGDRIGV